MSKKVSYQAMFSLCVMNNKGSVLTCLEVLKVEIFSVKLENNQFI